MTPAAHAPDAGRLVTQCETCGRAARWHGEETARLQGWHSRWTQKGPPWRWVRRWHCEECWIAPRNVVAAQATLPQYLAILVLSPKTEALALEQLDRVRGTELFPVYLDGIDELVKYSLNTPGKKKHGKHWSAYVRREAAIIQKEKGR